MAIFARNKLSSDAHAVLSAYKKRTTTKKIRDLIGEVKLKLAVYLLRARTSFTISSIYEEVLISRRI